MLQLVLVGWLVGGFGFGFVFSVCVFKMLWDKSSFPCTATHETNNTIHILSRI